MKKQNIKELNIVDKMQIASLVFLYVGFIFIVVTMRMFKQFMWQTIALLVLLVAITVGIILKKKISKNFKQNEIFSRELLQLLMTSIFILLIKFIVKCGNIAIKKCEININLDVFVIFCMILACLYLLYAVIIQIIVSINLIKLHKQEKSKDEK